MKSRKPRPPRLDPLVREARGKRWTVVVLEQIYRMSRWHTGFEYVHPFGCVGIFCDTGVQAWAMLRACLRVALSGRRGKR